MPPTNQTKITDHVRVYRTRPGRPKKKPQGGAAPAQGALEPLASASASNAEQRKKSPAKPHGKRGKTKTNYADPEDLARLTSAVED